MSDDTSDADARELVQVAIKLEQELGRPPTIKEVFAELGVSEKVIIEMGVNPNAPIKVTDKGKREVLS